MIDMDYPAHVDEIAVQGGSARLLLGYPACWIFPSTIPIQMWPAKQSKQNYDEIILMDET